MSNDGNEDRLSGKAKPVGGKLTGDEEMRSEGHAQETKGDVKKTVEDAKDTVKGIFKGSGGKDS